MGNRAVITFAPKSCVEKYRVKDGKNPNSVSGFVKDNANLVGVYVHWNGGIESVKAFCQAAKEIGFRCPTSDRSYGIARFTQLVANFFGGTSSTSIGVDTLSNLDTDNYDNGVYIVGEDWEIIGREFSRGYGELDDERVDDGFVKYLIDTQKGVDEVKKELDKKGE